MTMTNKTYGQRLRQLEADLILVAEAVIRLRTGLASLHPPRAPRRRIARGTLPRLVRGTGC